MKNFLNFLKKSRGVFFSFLVLFPLWAEAQTKEFVVGVEDIDYYPHYTLDEKGQYAPSYAREILEAFANSKGYKFIFKPMPVKRLFNSLVEKKVDFKYPDNGFWSADLKEGKGVVYSNPVTEYIDGVSVHPSRKGKGLESFKLLGQVLGFTAWGWMDLIKEKKVEVVENPQIKSLIMQVEKEKIHGVYCNVSIVKYQLEQVLKKPGAIVFDPDLPHTKSNYHLSTTKHPEIIKEFNEWMEKNSNTVMDLKKKYNVLL